MNKNANGMKMMTIEHLQEQALTLAVELESYAERLKKLHDDAAAFTSEEEADAIAKDEAQESPAYRLAGESWIVSSDLLEPAVERLKGAARITAEDLRAERVKREAFADIVKHCAIEMEAEP